MKRTRWIPLFTVLVLTLPPVSAPAQTRVQSVQEAIALAQRNNPELVNARQNRTLQDQQRIAAKAALLPQGRLYINFDYNYALPTQLIPAEFIGGQPGEFRTVRFGLPFTLTAGAEVTAPILNKPVRTDIDITSQNLRILDDQTLVLQDELSTQTARVYHAVLLARAAVAINQRTLASADTLVQIARVRLDKGLIEPLEYNRIRSVQLTTADVVQQNELTYIRNLNQLKLLLGLTLADSLVVGQQLTMQPIHNDHTNMALAAGRDGERPQVTLRRSQLELYKLQLEREKALRLPTLSAYIRYSEQAQRDRLDFWDFSKRWFPIGVAGLQFSLPLYTGGLRNSQIARARMRVKLAEAELAYERVRQQIDTEDIRNSYRQAIRSLDLNRQNYELSEQNVQISLVKYRSGLFSYDQYLNVFNEALQARNRYLSNLSTAFINQTILQLRN
ncbi:outer membrane channel protein TolC [Nibrella viscosa]|uniref:Outer membrane channel protein TolC n=1 Tax=Nibrella viscosa TaxID=1084524 RepID=A0ABP8L1P8_9BACT